MIRYSNDVIKIGGLDTDQDYYVLKLMIINLDCCWYRFTLSDENYKSKQFVGLTSVGSGNHIFNYPPIVVNVKGEIGVNTTTENFHARVNPIVRGSITSINVEKSGLGMEMTQHLTLVFHLKSVFLLVRPWSITIVTNGKIQSVIVTRSGDEYTSTPDLNILGDGVGAKLYHQLVMEELIQSLLIMVVLDIQPLQLVLRK